MREISILYSTEMVKAKLAGRKTMTRRTTKLEQINTAPDKWKVHYTGDFWKPSANKPGLPTFWVMFQHKETGERVAIKCPYGGVGDMLWVRESFAKVHYDGIDKEATYIYKADLPCLERIWKPSIHMPKAAARIWDEVVNIRVERLHDITEADALAEGVQENVCENPKDCISVFCADGCQGKGEYYRYPVNFDDEPCYSARESFQSLWQSINGEPSWHLNPWLWVVETKNLSLTGKPESLCHSQQK